MKRLPDVPGADWTGAGGFPLLRHLARAEALRATTERPRRGFLVELAHRLRSALMRQESNSAQASGLAASDLARSEGATCSRCGRRYLPRPTGARPSEDGRCRPCALGAAGSAVVQISARRRAR